MVDVQKSSLGPLDEHPFARLHRMMGKGDPVAKIGTKNFGRLVDLAESRHRRHLLPSLGPGGEVVQPNAFPDSPRKFRRGKGQLPRTQANPGGLVGIGWADATARRPDLFFAALLFGTPIDRPVMRQHQMGLGGKMKTASRANSPFMQSADFGNQTRRIHHRPSGNETGNAGTENSRGYEVKNIFFPTDLHGVAGIVPPLRAENPVGLPRHHVKNLAFPLIPPLEAENNGNAGFQGRIRGRTGGN